MRGKPSFRQSDLTRAAKGLKAAGVEVSRVEIEPSGRIVLHTDGDNEPEAVSALDAWKRKRDARPA
ncbi:hypothetical protein [Stappia sp. WLB 29]|uniref:hypothetical protein n=1 Tax=Stappia sp. WLB 29 TaxID=2925220 RepID=UPI0020BE3CAD|nr:hypothetical protein [Stappia sp. WLB 29]